MPKVKKVKEVKPRVKVKEIKKKQEEEIHIEGETIIESISEESVSEFKPQIETVTGPVPAEEALPENIEQATPTAPAREISDEDILEERGRLYSAQGTAEQAVTEERRYEPQSNIPVTLGRETRVGKADFSTVQHLSPSVEGKEMLQVREKMREQNQQTDRQYTGRSQQSKKRYPWERG